MGNVLTYQMILRYTELLPQMTHQDAKTPSTVTQLLKDIDEDIVSELLTILENTNKISQQLQSNNCGMSWLLNILRYWRTHIQK
jgi:hypothetical protein